MSFIMVQVYLDLSSVIIIRKEIQLYTFKNRLNNFKKLFYEKINVFKVVFQFKIQKIIKNYN